MNVSTSCNDGSFGPGVRGCKRDFDFTLTFEDSILSILPSAILIVLAPIRVIQLRGARCLLVRGQSFRLMKLSAIGVYGILQLTLLILYSLLKQRQTGVGISTATLTFADAIVFCALSYLEHSKSLRPSAFLGVYLFFTLLFDAAKVRTLWLMHNSRSIRNVFTASVAMKLVILVLEAGETRRYLSSVDRQKSPEETSGIFNQGIFWWLNGLIRTGFSKVLEMNDLYPIDERMTANELGGNFRSIWGSLPNGGDYKLVMTLLKLFRWQIIAPILPRLCLIGFTFCQPLLLNRYLKFLQDPTESTSIGYGLLGAYGIVYFGLAVSTGFYWHRVFRWLTMVRGSLVSSIYHKTTEISITALDNSAAITLMSTDIDRIELGLKFVHEIWANTIQICLATWLLQRQLGLACFAPIAIACLSAAGSTFIAKGAGRKQVIWVKAIQKRVGITSTMLGGMKGVKMSGLTPKFADLIQNLRINELSEMASFRMVMIYCAVIAFAPQQISPIVTFGAFIGFQGSDGHVLDTSRLFTSVSLLVLLNQPLAQVFQSIPSFMSAIGCLGRIQTFLSTESRQDTRVLCSKILSSKENSSPGSEKERLGPVESPINLQLSDTKRPSTERTSDTHTTSEVIVISNGSFGWKPNGPLAIQNISISVLRSQLTILIGPVASGKSTLLGAILGETPISKGSIQVSTLDFSFCDQTPWLLSQSIQKNVIGFAHLDSEWYHTVLRACALEDDISLLPHGDQTLIGSNGISLSGGQKQRLAIARAVYARKEVAIFDDVFSGLDSATERHVFEHLFGSSGILRLNGTTIIVATHAVNLLPWADQIIALNKTGHIIEQGTFPDLNSQKGSYVHSFALQSISNHPKPPKSEPTPTIKPSDPSPHISYSKDSAQDKARQTGDLSVYKYYFAAAGRKSMTIFWTLSVTWVALETFPTVWLKWWSSAITANLHPSNAKYLGVYAALQMGCLVALFACAVHVFNFMQVRSGATLHNTTLKTVMRAPLSFFSSVDTGVTLNRFSQDIQLIDGELPNALFDVVGLALGAVGQAILIASATWYIAAGFPVLIAVFYLIQMYYLRTSRQLRFMDIEAKSPLYTQFIETLNGLPTLRAFNLQAQNHALNNDLLDNSQRPVYLLWMIQRWLTLVMDLISLALALLVVGLSLKLRDTVSIGFTGVALVNIISFGQNIKWVVIQWTQLETAIGAVSRIKSFSQSTPNENLRGETSSCVEHWPSEGRIVIKDLSVSYCAQGSGGGDVIRGLHLSIRAGEKLGICGRSGSGKSSLMAALFQLLSITQGSITIDGVDISRIPRQEIRSRLNALPQEPYFLHGSVRENLDPWERRTDVEILCALEKVGLVEAVGGLGEMMDEAALSMGQKQLFCLARAVLRGGKIVVLDEASSCVDRKTDELMQRIIREEFADSTIIAIAHRLETIMDFDRIAVLQNGELKECDTPSNLLARDSYFRELYEQKKEQG